MSGVIVVLEVFQSRVEGIGPGKDRGVETGPIRKSDLTGREGKSRVERIHGTFQVTVQWRRRTGIVDGVLHSKLFVSTTWVMWGSEHTCCDGEWYRVN